MRGKWKQRKNDWGSEALWQRSSSQQMCCYEQLTSQQHMRVWIWPAVYYKARSSQNTGITKYTNLRIEHLHAQVLWRGTGDWAEGRVSQCTVLIFSFIYSISLAKTYSVRVKYCIKIHAKLQSFNNKTKFMHLWTLTRFAFLFIYLYKYYTLSLKISNELIFVTCSVCI